MTTEKRKHLAAWFSIIFIFVTLASLFYIVKEENHKCNVKNGNNITNHFIIHISFPFYVVP